MSEPRTVKQLLAIGLRVLDDSTHLFDDHDHEMETHELLGMCLEVDDVDDVDDEFVPPRRIRERYLALVARRAGGEPFPFLTGYIDIYGLRLPVRSGAFIPRPSSELPIDMAVKMMKRKKGAVIVDVCTGQGPIALTIAHALPETMVYAADIDAGGLAQGRKNARSLGIRNVKFLEGDMYAPLPKRLKGSVDLITGHVPYVAQGELEDLPAEVTEYEPIYTLSDLSEDGMFLMRRAVAESPEWLKPGGWLLLELAEDLAPKVKKMCRQAGFTDIKSRTDHDKLSWVVTARKPKTGLAPR